VILLTTALLAGMATAPVADPSELAHLMAVERPAPQVEISYGPAASQGIDVFLPTGEGPHPVVVMIHGGCWRDMPGAGRQQLRHLALDLARRGIGVWSIGYRRANEAGGGHPGTFDDVGVAIDKLVTDASKYNFDLGRAILVGHSAGGHLALWAASRFRLPADHRFHSASSFRPKAVISLGGIGDLRAFAPKIPATCGPDILEGLTRPIPGTTADPFKAISPAELPAPEADIVMISGTLDRLVPPYVAYDYFRAMRDRQKKAVELVDLPWSSHWDLVMTGTPAWAEISRRIDAALGIKR
jgi:acetyl esterase/lipase